MVLAKESKLGGVCISFAYQLAKKIAYVPCTNTHTYTRVQYTARVMTILDDVINGTSRHRHRHNSPGRNRNRPTTRYSHRNKEYRNVFSRSPADRQGRHPLRSSTARRQVEPVTVGNSYRLPCGGGGGVEDGGWTYGFRWTGGCPVGDP